MAVHLCAMYENLTPVFRHLLSMSAEAIMVDKVTEVLWITGLNIRKK